MSKQIKPFSWRSFGTTNVGNVRKHNEDAFLDMSEKGVWVIADGMGGHFAGDFASQAIVSAMQEEVDFDLPLDACIDQIEDQLMETNAKLIDKAMHTTGRGTIGSTVVMLMIYNEYCVYFWMGDSRLYRLRDNSLRQMTTDHSQVEEFIERGLITREEASIHPNGNVITRAVGASDSFFLDMEMQTIRSSDRYLLCSDGLTKHVFDFELESMLKEHQDTEIATNKMIDLCLLRGGTDNVSAILVDVS